jgi:hypothetical protein
LWAGKRAAESFLPAALLPSKLKAYSPMQLFFVESSAPTLSCSFSARARTERRNKNSIYLLAFVIEIAYA